MINYINGGTQFLLVKEINSKVIFFSFFIFFLALGSAELPTPAILSAWTIQTSGMQTNCSPGKFYLVVMFVSLSVLLAFFLFLFLPLFLSQSFFLYSLLSSFLLLSSTCLCNKLVVQPPSIHPRGKELEGYSVMTPPWLTAWLIKHVLIKAFQFLWWKPIHHSQPWGLKYVFVSTKKALTVTVYGQYILNMLRDL